MKNRKHKIEIIFSYTGTAFSKFLKLMTRSKYVHISICLDGNPNEIYSFGRKNPRHMLPAGFVKEDLKYISELYKKAICLVYEKEIDEKQFNNLKNCINEYIKEQDKYQYDILGLTFMVIGKPYQRRYHRVCSQFVGMVVQKAQIYDFEGKHYSLIKPNDFYNMPDKERIYQGNLREYFELIKGK